MTKNSTSFSSDLLENSLNRRGFLRVAGELGLSALSLPTLLASGAQGCSLFKPAQFIIPSSEQELFLSFYNQHTGESLRKCVFWAQGTYNKEGLQEINKLFRDHRTHAVHEIDYNLFHILYKIHQYLETTEPFHLISGYRSPKSNRQLCARSRGVAKNSLHVQGKAADIYVPHRSLVQLQRAAAFVRAGGVGRYKEFVHVDTGRIRSWGPA